MREYSEIPQAVSVLAEEYSSDLKKVRDLSPVIVTEFDINEMSSLAMKYELKYTITRSNYAQARGLISAEILRRLENLSIEHILESQRELNIKKKPRRQKDLVDQVPEQLK